MGAGVCTGGGPRPRSGCPCSVLQCRTAGDAITPPTVPATDGRPTGRPVPTRIDGGEGPRPVPALSEEKRKPAPKTLAEFGTECRTAAECRTGAGGRPEPSEMNVAEPRTLLDGRKFIWLTEREIYIDRNGVWVARRCTRSRVRRREFQRDRSFTARPDLR